MKQNIRKILAALVLAVSVLGLTACGNAAAAETEIPVEEELIKAVTQAMVNNWETAQEGELQGIANEDSDILEELVETNRQMGSFMGYFTADSLRSAYAGYLSSREELGALIFVDSFEELEIKGDEATLVANLTYENRGASLSMVFNKRNIVQSVALDPKYSTGEILKKAGMNTILGMGTVFIVLIFISLVIYCFNFIPGNRTPKEEEKKRPAPKPRPAKKAASKAAKENLVDDKELVAAITAAICAYNGTSPEGFVVRSIRRAESSRWKKA